jgi:hypothetical protein
MRGMDLGYGLDGVLFLLGLLWFGLRLASGALSTFFLCAKADIIKMRKKIKISFAT